MASVPSHETGGSLWDAMRDPEAYVLRWHQTGRRYPLAVFLVLAAVAVLGTTAYGALWGAPDGPARVLDCALRFTVAAALSWIAPLPAVYILNSIAGSRLRASTTFLAALVTASWGGLGFLALLPIAGAFLITVSNRWVILTVHLLVLAVVGACMAVVYCRLQTALEPHRGGRSWWLWLFVCLMAELLYAFGVLQLPAAS